MFTFKTPLEKLRIRTLNRARLELEQRILEIEHRQAIVDMLQKQIARLEPLVEQDEADRNQRKNERYARRLPVSIPGSPPKFRRGGQVPPSEPANPPQTSEIGQ
jgi:hypothetical protein